MRTIPFLGALAAALVLAAAPAGAQTHRTVITAQLDTLAATMARDGFAPDRAAVGRESMIGLLPNGGMVLLEVQLRAGHRYTIGAGCDTDCDDLDLRAFAPDGQTVLDEDVEGDDVPIVSFTARESGPHLLAVSMARCNEELCYFGFRVLAK